MACIELGLALGDKSNIDRLCYRYEHGYDIPAVWRGDTTSNDEQLVWVLEVGRVALSQHLLG